MKRLKWIGLVVMLIAMCTCAHSASAAPVVSVEPVSIEVTEGETFTVNIIVDPAGSEIRGVEYKLYFDNTLVSATEQTPGNFLGGVNMPNDINNTISMIMYGEFKISGVAATAPGILATITFNATSHGVCDLTLDDIILSDQEAEEIPGVVILSGTCTIKAVEQIPAPTPTETEPTMSARMTTEVETTETEDQTTPDIPSPPLPDPGQITPPLTPAPARAQQPDEDETAEQSGFVSAFAAMGLLIVSYLILRKND
jgi:hypothetical protein